ncbi:hypothetical protein ACIBF6_24900 [Streptosporangium amethystogenes]|uniref:hypothetical protein n=1 Tax=Streptosporangium amethystogenes TaxID=2002 RepID=UPI0037A0F7D0
MAVLLFPFRHLRAVPTSDLLIGAAIVALGTLEAFTIATETTELWWVGQALVTGLALHACVARVHRLTEQTVRLERDREREAAEAVARERARIARELSAGEPIA